MISVLPASSAEDFEIAAGLYRALGQWDAETAPSHGVSAEDVLLLFHPEKSGNELATEFLAADTIFLIARVEGEAAGCLAFDPFDDRTAELHKFFVGPQFRGKGIGRALMGIALAEIGKGPRPAVYIHTTSYMTSAIDIYQSFGFTACPRFRETPEHVRHTDVFMSRTLPSR